MTRFPAPHNNIRESYKLFRRIAEHRAILIDTVSRLWSVTESDFKDPEMGKNFSEICKLTLARCQMDIEDPIRSKMVNETLERFETLIGRRKKHEKRKRSDSNNELLQPDQLQNQA